MHASSDECFQAFLSKVISWEPLPHTLVFPSFYPIQVPSRVQLLTWSQHHSQICFFNLKKASNSEIPTVWQQPVQFPFDVLVVCHLQQGAFDGNGKNPELGALGWEPGGRLCMEVKCRHHGVGQATSANEDKPVDEAVQTSYHPLVFWMREPFVLHP